MQITPRDISVVIPVKDGKVFLERAKGADSWQLRLPFTGLWS